MDSERLIEQIKLGPNGLESIVYPEDAFRYITKFAVLHRDYSIAADVQVRIFDNRVEIGEEELPGHVTVDWMTQLANPKLVRCLVNKFQNPPNKDVGEGSPHSTFEAMDKLRRKKPLFEERENSLLVILRHEISDRRSTS